jgi:predicted SprT family Zn-dependent metalloprotease
MLKKDAKKLVKGLAPYEKYHGGYTVLVDGERAKVNNKRELATIVKNAIENNPISIVVTTNKKSNTGDWIPDQKHTIYEDNSIIEKIKEEYNNDFKKTRAEIKAIDLYPIYEEMKELYFSDKDKVTSEINLKWSARLTSSAGNCRAGSKLIKLSVDYHRKHPEEIENTLIHEMIHLYISGHPKKFHDEIARINKQAGKEVVSRYSQESANVSHVAYCPKHKVIGTKTRKPKSGRYRCRACGSKIRWIEVD